MPDSFLCIGSGDLPSGEHYKMNGPIEITQEMGYGSPLSPSQLDSFCDEFSSRGGQLRWEENAFHLYWQPNAEWPYRDEHAWRDVEVVQVNFAALMKKWKLKVRKIELVSNSSAIDDLTLAFVDVETNGRKASYSKIIEICICRVQPGMEPEWFTTYVNPGKKLPEEITAITGIRDADLKEAPRFKAIAQRVHSLLSNAVLISHQTNGFDERFIATELASSDFQWQPSSRLSTVTITQALYSQLPNYKLKTIAQELSLPIPTHRAKTDVTAMIALWEKLKQRASERTPALSTLGQFLSL